MKTCNGCLTPKELDEFGPRRGRSKCNQCRAKAQRMYNSEHRKEQRDYSAKYRADHPKEVALSKARYCAENPDKIIIKSAQYYAKNTEKIVAKNAQWAARNPERVADNKVKWKIENPEKVATAGARRRANKKNAPGGHHTAQERMAKFEKFDNICAYFPRKGCTKTATTLDHVMPLSKGGSNAISNCVPACTHCNSAKGSRLGWVPRNPGNP